MAFVTVFIFQNTVNGSLHCSYLLSAPMNCLVSAAAGCCLCCVLAVKDGAGSLRMLTKAASRENGLSGLTYPYI